MVLSVVRFFLCLLVSSFLWIFCLASANTPALKVHTQQVKVTNLFAISPYLYSENI